MGWIRKFVYFTVLADREEIAELSSYDRSIIYASCVRQTLGAAFTFLVFLYACSTIMPLWISIVIATVLALIIFFLDQAIIGSEWTMHRDFSRHWLINGPVSFVVKLVQLLPRIAYAVAIAWFMATLAEIAIQSRAIDRVLNERTSANNSVYFERTDELALQHDTALMAINTEISELEATIRTRSDPSAAQTIVLLEAEVQDAADTIVTLSGNVTALRNQVMLEQAGVASLQSRVTNLVGKISANRELMSAEVDDPTRCGTPGAEFCRGDRWRELRDTLITNENELGPLEAQLNATREQLQSTQNMLSQAETAITAARNQADTATGELQQTQRTTSSLEELQEELAALVASHAALLAQQEQEVAELEQTLISTGNRDFANYGPLDRRIGLQALHDHPEYGAVARQFSWELKIVIILFELSPILVTIFFTPFSFLSLRMRQKRDAILGEEAQQHRKHDAENVQSIAVHDVDTHAERTDASAKMNKKARDVGLVEAKEQDAYDDEMLILEKKCFEREAALSDYKQQTHEASYNDDEELQEIERAIHKEAKRQEWLRARTLTTLLTKQAQNETRRYTNGEKDD